MSLSDLIDHLRSSIGCEKSVSQSLDVIGGHWRSWEVIRGHWRSTQINARPVKMIKEAFWMDGSDGIG